MALTTRLLPSPTSLNSYPPLFPKVKLLTAMVYCREVHFNQACPPVPDVVKRVSRRMGIPLTYLPDKWLLVNSMNQADLIGFYQQEDRVMVLTNEGPMTNMLRRTLQVLIELGGECQN